MASFTYDFKGGTHIVTATGQAQMQMLLRSRKEYFTDFLATEVKARKLKVAVNGSFIELGRLSTLAVLAKDAPLDASASTPTGPVVQDGKRLAGVDAPGKFNFAQDDCGTRKFSAGAGNPARSACAAIGGIAPIVIDGLPYGAQNVYKPGVPAGAPITGDVAPRFLPYLTQKSNAMFSALLTRGSAVGKVAIGFSSRLEKLTILVQADGTPGVDADGIRSMFIAAGASHAVFLDCSDSATLYYDGKFLVRPGKNKNEFLTVAVGFQ